jgi:hypothetical protein
MTWPFQVAKQYGIDLIVWGEHGFAELTGMVSLNDFVEFTNWKRKEHDMRGINPEDIVGENGITEQDVRPLVWPEGEAATGIYLSNFLPWNAKHQAEQMVREWNFAPVTYPRERTFVQYAKIEDHANDLHDYLKFLKFGYGRATDDATTEIRHGRMTRAQGVDLVRRYDPVEPSTLEEYCDFLGITSADFYSAVPERQQTEAPPIDGDELAQSEERTFAFTSLYYDPENPPPKSGDERLDRLGQFQPI